MGRKQGMQYLIDEVEANYAKIRDLNFLQQVKQYQVTYDKQFLEKEIKLNNSKHDDSHKVTGGKKKMVKP